MISHVQLFRSVTIAMMLAVAGSAFGQTPTCAAPGCNAVASDTYGNTATGTNALVGVQAASGGAYNTASGNFALNNNTTGADNTANGYSALYLNTTGSNNTASGDSALASNTSGSENTANGIQA